MKKTFYIFFALLFFAQLLSAQSLQVASYNIRNANQTDSINGNGWHQRCPVIAQLIEYNDFDIIGMQEVLDTQKNDLLRALPQYAHVGIGRDDAKTKGEYSSIFYKKDKFEELQSGNFWLSEHTDYPNKGWDARYPRICTWVQLKDKISNKIVWFFNLHMDHVGVVARRESSKLVMHKIKEMCGADAFVLTGDFNVTQTNESYELLANSDIFSDSYEVAKVRYAPNGTFNGFDPNCLNEDRIDHIFVSSHFSVDKYGILTDTYRGVSTKDGKEKYVARVPSDHFPVSVLLQYRR